MLKPFKFTVQAHLLRYDEEGNVVDEAVSDAVPLYGKSLVEVAPQFDEMLVKGLDRTDVE